MNKEKITAELFRLQDKKYAAFQTKLIPTSDADRIIGVRTPELRALAKKIAKDNYKEFFEQNKTDDYWLRLLHAFVIGYGSIRDPALLLWHERPAENRSRQVLRL